MSLIEERNEADFVVDFAKMGEFFELEILDLSFLVLFIDSSSYR